VPQLHIDYYYFLKKLKSSNFGGISTFLKLIAFQQFLAILGRIEAQFAALIVAESMLKARLKS
jgi:hypothetical protein